MKTSNFGVNYVELDNSPRLRFSRKTNSAIRQFLVYDWDQVQDFARELIGSYSVEGVVVTNVPPLAFPGFPTLLCNDIAIDPLLPDSPRGDDVADLYNDVNAYDAGAIITANYTTQYDDAGGDIDIELPDGTTILLEGDQGTEIYNTPGRTWRWGSVAGNPVVDPDTYAGILVPTDDWSITWGRVPLPPWQVIREMKGKVNDAVFNGAEAGTVLFAGARSRRMFQFVEDVELWEFTYSFRQVSKERNDGSIVGWNYFYREQASGGEHWHTIQNVSGNPPYKSGDFNSLFEFPITVPGT
jgi:hypothetical protein